MNPLKWKVWGSVFAACSFVVFATLKYIAYLKRGKEAAEHHAATVEKRSTHQAVTTEAARKAAEEAPRRVLEAVEKSKGDNNLDHFR